MSVSKLRKKWVSSAWMREKWSKSAQDCAKETLELLESIDESERQEVFEQLFKPLSDKVEVNLVIELHVCKLFGLEPITDRLK